MIHIRTLLTAAVAVAGLASVAPVASAQAQTVESAQAFLQEVNSQGNVSVRLGAQASGGKTSDNSWWHVVSASNPGRCTTSVRGASGGSITIDWSQVSSIAIQTNDYGWGGYSHWVQVLGGLGAGWEGSYYVYESRAMNDRVYKAMEFLRANCDAKKSKYGF